MSAIKVAPHHHSLAIHGTNLNDSRVEEILAQPKYDRIYLCLDNDAVYEAIKLQLKWRHRLPKMLVLGLQKDIKDMNDEEFAEFLTRLS
jgi:DNA primase